ncbi:MAG: CDF family Co(II)/Ni(II) efflux transporter DmeF [Kiritimatiellales bacterium]|jgi:cation diffusion facilitator family transporter
MNVDNPDRWQHAHTFGQENERAGEKRTVIVTILTAVMMVAEVAAGIVFGSMALLADGLHMASHAAALFIAWLAYIYARRHASDPRYSFGTGKVNSLGGYTGAILLALFAALMVWESTKRVIHPVDIAFNQAIFVAVLGLIVNGVSVFILGLPEHHHDHHHEDHDHHHDHNLRSAYLHVLADALTSVLAIAALLVAKYTGFMQIDPIMGIVGAVVVLRWSVGLLRASSLILLDQQGSAKMTQKIKNCIEKDGDNWVVDLHLWSIGPGIFSAAISLVTRNPQSAEYYKRLIPAELGVAHVTLEVNHSDVSA